MDNVSLMFLGDKIGRRHKEVSKQELTQRTDAKIYFSQIYPKTKYHNTKTNAYNKKMKL